MYFTASTIDDLMHSVFTELHKRQFDIYSTRSQENNPTSEIIGCTLHLSNPRARLSRSEMRGKPFSALGELLWYLSGTNDLAFIEYYISQYKKESVDGKTIYGGYGPRLFNLHGEYNQIDNIIDLLTRKKSSRKAVIQIFDGADIKNSDEIPCTCILQFLIRNDKLNLVVFMRSNDAYKGLPHDIFAFTMLQEIIARSLSVELGEYYHSVGSLHLYLKDKEKSGNFINEGYQSTKFPMPVMPIGNPWSQIKLLLQVEAKIRLAHAYSLDGLNSYWSDIARLLQVYSFLNAKNYAKIQQVKSDFISEVYKTYIHNKLDKYLSLPNE